MLIDSMFCMYVCYSVIPFSYFWQCSSQKGHSHSIKLLELLHSCLQVFFSLCCINYFIFLLGYSLFRYLSLFYAFVKHFDMARVWNMNKSAMAFATSWYGVITGVLCGTDLQVTHKGYQSERKNRQREKWGLWRWINLQANSQVQMPDWDKLSTDPC